MDEIYTFLNNIFQVKYTKSQWNKFAKIWNLLHQDLGNLDLNNLSCIEFNDNMEQIIETAFAEYDETIIQIENGKININFPIKRIEEILNEAD